MIKKLMLLFIIAITCNVVAQTPLPSILSGGVKGTMLQNQTYTIKDSIFIKAGDTLKVQPGVKLYVNNKSGWIHIFGAFICEGTATNRIKIGGALGTEKAGPGQWGGFWGDSCSVFSVKFTDIINAGGPKANGSGNYRTIDLYSNYANTMKVVFTDNTIINTVDDGITIHGGNVSVLRNVLKFCGAPDGDNISMKDGAWGEVAYNLVWGSGGSSLKVGSSNKTGRITNICVHNNTCVLGGWRRLDEPGPSIRVEKNGRAQIYNNIFGDCYYGIDIQSAADVKTTVYGNNLFFGSADSLRKAARYYPTDPAYKAVGVAQTTDILDVKASDLFVNYQTPSKFTNTNYTDLDGTNNYALKAGSPAIGKGITPPSTWTNPAFGTGVILPGNKDMGAFVAGGLTSPGSTLPAILSGAVKGTLLQNQTYTIADSIYIKAGDTLSVQSGVKLYVNNKSGWIHIFGSFICEGTATNRIKIGGALGTEKAGPGQWGGFWGDSCSVFSVKFTDIINAGGPKANGSGNYRTIDLYSNYANTMKVVFTDNTITNTVDDGITIHGGNVSVLRNILKFCGAPDGDNISMKDGAWGEVAYNLVWGSGGSSLKVGSSNKTGRITNICVHNNTCVLGGWRRLDEPGPSIRVEKNGRAQIYNNIFGDCYYGIDIQSAADVKTTVYGNNLFFGSADSLRKAARYYPTDPAYKAVGVTQSNDILDVKASDLFVNYQTPSKFTNTTFTALDGTNNYSLKAGSPAIGKGMTPPATWTNPSFGTGVILPGSKDIGAFVTGGLVAAVEVENELPFNYSLNQNYPNPFNPSTQISYSIPEAGVVSLRVYDVLGRQVAELVNGNQNAGHYTISFNAAKLSSGIYFYTIQSGKFSQTKKMLLVK